MRQFKDYLWGKIQVGLLLSWASLVVIFVMIYGSLVLLEKEQQLASSLQVAAYTVRTSMDAGEWPLALGHLTKLEEKGPVFNIELSNKNKTDLVGPFGHIPFGFGRACRVEPVAEGVNLKGCMVVFGMEEIVTLGLLIMLGFIIYALMYKAFSSNIYTLIEKISHSLRSIGEPDIPALKEENKIAEIKSINEYVCSLVNEAKEVSKVKAIGELSVQVAHDVRSPLTALDMAIKDAMSLPEEKRLLIRNAVNRIHDIANNLLKFHRAGAACGENQILNTEISPIITMMEMIISEKRSQYQGFQVEFELMVDDNARLMFSAIKCVEFKRMISNLIDNAVEAIPAKKGTVTLSLKANEDQVSIKIADNGIGIPDHKLNDIFSKKPSQDKPDGHGLGLSHAHALVTNSGGSIRINSIVNLGTTVEIQLPPCPAPDWLVEKIGIKKNSTIIILDDDPSIHQVWKQCFASHANQGIKMIHFCSIELFNDWLINNRNNLWQYHFFVDYEILDSQISGAQLINEFDINRQSILVTSRYEEIEVIELCVRSGIKMLPKSTAAYVPINIDNEQLYDAVLIDDDPLIRESWLHSAAKYGKSIKVFSCPNDFLSIHDEFSRECTIFIDSKLENNQLGEIIAEDIYRLGFKNIHLVTGMPVSEYQSFPYLSSIIGKFPIWESNIENLL